MELGDFFYAAGNPCSWFISPASSMTSTVLTEEEEQVISDAEDEARVEELIRPVRTGSVDIIPSLYWA